MRYIQPDWIVHRDERTAKKDATPINSIHVNADNTKVVTAGLDTRIRVWATESIVNHDPKPDAHRLLFTGTAHNGSVMCARFSSSGRYIASGADDRILAVWQLQQNADGTSKKVWGSDEVNTEVWKPIRMLAGHENDILSVAWSDDDAYLASGGVDTLILIWDGYTFAPLRKLAVHQEFVKGLAFDPAGQFLASQDTMSVKIWNTQDWSLAKDVTKPFIDAPNDHTNWFLRPSWSPDGTNLVTPNSMNGPVFVAGIVDRGRNWTSDMSLVGHQNIVVVAAFAPIMLLKDASVPPTEGANVLSLLALAARSSISIWLTSVATPLVVIHDVFARDILDLQWSSDANQLWACSSDGHIACLSFDPDELTHSVHRAPKGALREFHASQWGFTRPVRMPFPSAPASVPTSTVLTPTGPPEPQKTTIMANGKRRIQPSLLSAQAGPPAVVQQSFFGPTSSAASTPVFPAVTTLQPEPSAIHRPASKVSGPGAVFAAANSAPATSKLPTRPPSPGKMRLQRDVSFPSPMALTDEPMWASSSAARASMPPNLDTDFALKPPKHNRFVRGPTLGGDRDKEKAKVADLVSEELMPAFIPESSGSKALRLAVPAVKTFAKIYMSDVTEGDVDDGTAMERLEVRNFKDGTNRPSEVAHVGPNGSDNADKTMWVDYLEHKVVSGTWNGKFGAVSTLDGGLHVYSPAGRRLLPFIYLDAPCSYIDSAGHYLLAITARGKLHVWNVQTATATFRPLEISELLESALSSAGSVRTIRSARVRPNGAPVITLSDGRIFTYDPKVQAWTALSLTWWSKGSEQWEARARSRSTTGRGVLKTLEGATNDIMIDLLHNQRHVEGAGMDLDVDAILNVQGEEQEKLGHEDDWNAALTLGHLENRLAACEALDSPQEYKATLLAYATRLGSDGFRNKAEELVRHLMGPVYYKPGAEWQSTVCGFQKRDLLKEILACWGRSSHLKKLAADSQELLRRVTDPA